jgi:hypothetical protein
MSHESSGGALARVDAWLTEMRATPRRRRLALAFAVGAGLALTAVHWIGLFVAGALVGLTRQSLLRAMAAGLGFGVFVLALFFLLSPAVSPGPFLSLAPLSYLTVGLAIAGPVWGSLLRGAL